MNAAMFTSHGNNIINPRLLQQVSQMTITIGKMYYFGTELVRVLRLGVGRTWLCENPVTKTRYLLFRHQLGNQPRDYV